MRYGIPALLLCAAQGALAVFSEFVHITPETRDDYGLEVCVSSDAKDINGVLIRVRIPRDGHKVAWLITSTSHLDPEKQKFRNHIWKDPDGNSPSSDSPIVKISLLGHSDSDPENVHIEIPRSEMSNSYVYVDFPYAVFDGGYFYSVDLDAFSEIDDGEC